MVFLYLEEPQFGKELMNKMISQLCDASLSNDELKKTLNVSETFPTKLSNQLSENIAIQFLNNQLSYDEAAIAINNLFIIWMSKPYTEDFGNSSWVVHDAFENADDFYEEDDKTQSIEVAKKLLKEVDFISN